MVNLLALWRAHGVDAILREAWQAGIVLAGLSAGSMCWFEWGVTKSVGRPTLAHAACGGSTPKECRHSGGAVVCVPDDYVCCNTDKCAQACRGYQQCVGKSCSDTSKICGFGRSLSQQEPDQVLQHPRRGLELLHEL